MPKKLPFISFSIVLWWLCIIALSLSGASKIRPPSVEVLFIVLVSLLFFIFGGVFSFSLKPLNYNFGIFNLSENFVRFCLFLILLMALQPLVSMIFYVWLNGFENFRSIAFEISEDGTSIVFGSLRYQFVLNNFVKPFLYFLIFLSFYKFFFLKSKNSLFFSIFVLFIFSITTLGRFFVYHIAVLFIISFFLYVLSRGFIVKYKDLKVFPIFVILCLVFGLVITLFRDVGGVLESLIDYHVLGLGLLSLEYENLSSPLHREGFYFTFLGFFERFSVIVFSRFEPDIQSYVALNESYLSAFRDVGDGKSFNAFGTFFFTLIHDGGVLFSCFFMLIAGFLSAHFENSFNKFKNFSSFFVILFIFFIFFFSVFTSMLHSSYIMMLFYFFIFNWNNSDDIHNNRNV